MDTLSLRLRLFAFIINPDSTMYSDQILYIPDLLVHLLIQLSDKTIVSKNKIISPIVDLNDYDGPSTRLGIYCVYYIE
jgi:hypothetical protein